MSHSTFWFLSEIGGKLKLLLRLMSENLIEEPYKFARVKHLNCSAVEAKWQHGPQIRRSERMSFLYAREDGERSNTIPKSINKTSNDGSSTHRSGTSPSAAMDTNSRRASSILP